MSNRKLPEATLAHLKQQHPKPERFEQFVSACLSEPRLALRINTRKISLTEFQQRADQNQWQLSPIPWTQDGFWVDYDALQALGNHIDHLTGLYYLQESTSMLPVEALFHNHSPKLILDMAAAPGSKTTQLNNHLNEGFIVANDMSSSRVKMLNANLIRCGLADVALMHQDARQLPEQLNATFDGILLDAPCGGDGTIRKDPKAWSNWSPDSLQSLSDLQKQLIETAWQLLAPSGRLIYSTCSLSREENQQVVEHLLQLVGDEAQLVSLDSLFSGANEVSDGAMLHIWPEVFNTEGFFVAAIEKIATADCQPHTLEQHAPGNPLSNKQYNLVQRYLSDRFGFNISDYKERLAVQDSNKHMTVWLKPKCPGKIQGLHTQRSGIKVCNLFQSRKGLGITLDHEFCRTYGGQCHPHVLPLSEADVVSYFKGMNIHPEHDLSEGEIILTHLSQPIGLGKVLKNGQIKNQLPRPLVHDNTWA